MACASALLILLCARGATAFTLADAPASEAPFGPGIQYSYVHSSLYGLLSRACPDSRIEAHELDAVRTVEGKLAIAAALRAAARTEGEVRFGQAGPDGRYRFANTPREVAQVVRQGLGSSSLISRGVDTLALIVDAAEYTTQVPLDQMNTVADFLVDGGRRFGLGNLPSFRFRSRIENDRAGVTLSARW